MPIERVPIKFAIVLKMITTTDYDTHAYNDCYSLYWVFTLYKTRSSCIIEVMWTNNQALRLLNNRIDR